MINRIAELAKENAELKALISQRDASVAAQAEIILKLKTENVEIKTSYINFIAKLKREIITKDDIQDLKNTVKKFVEERNSLRFENKRLKEELATYGATGVCEVCSDKANKLADKYLGCLQEIKTRIPEDYKIYQWYEDVIQLITKAESEG